MNYFIHNSSDVQSSRIGFNTKIWQYVVILKNAVIGKNCNINSHVFIENDVSVGDNVTIKSGVQLWDGVTIKNNVFVGPNVTFTNGLLPRSKKHPKSFIKTNLLEGCSIGANTTIICGNTIGKYALVGAGAVVTKDIANNELWIGNPAKKTGYVTNDGIILDLNLKSLKGGLQYFWDGNLLKIK